MLTGFLNRAIDQVSVAAGETNPEFPVWGIFLIIFGFALIFPMFWCGVVLLISRMGDWSRLARTFAAGDRPPAGERHAGVTGWVGIARYKFTLVAHISGDGFFLETGPLFRIGHPRLFIPWSAVVAREKRSILGWEVNVLTIGSPSVGKIGLVLPLHEPV